MTRARDWDWLPVASQHRAEVAVPPKHWGRSMTVAMGLSCLFLISISLISTNLANECHD